MTSSVVVAREMALRIRRVRLPQSGKDWAILGILFVIIAALWFLGKHFLPNINEKLFNIILVAVAVLILIISGYGS